MSRGNKFEKGDKSMSGKNDLENVAIVCQERIIWTCDKSMTREIMWKCDNRMSKENNFE